MAAKSTQDNPDHGKGAPAAEQPAEGQAKDESQKDVVGGDREVTKVYDSMAAGAGVAEPKKDHVVYAGIGTNRIITRGQWERAGVADQDDAGWTSRNGYAFPLSNLNDAAIEVLREDGQFVFPDDKKD